MEITPTSLTPELSVVMPCYNEAPLLEESLREWKDTLERLVSSFEVIVVNDGSKDGSGRILDRLRKELGCMRVIHQLNGGHQRAVWRGYEAARGSYVLQVDLSGRFDPAEFEALWKRKNYYPLVLGKRAGKPEKRLGGLHAHLVKKILKYYYACEVADPESRFRLFRREVVMPFLAQLAPGSQWVNLLMTALLKREHPDYVTEVEITYKRRPAFFRTSEREATARGRFKLNFGCLSELMAHRHSPANTRLPLTFPTR